MLTVSLLIEILRTRPRLIFWLVALSQTFLWFVVPSVFYSAPPGDVAEVVSVGREMAFNASFGPPLAFWLAEIAMRVTGNHVFGVYLLSQACILVAYWAMFQLGRATIGERHAMLAILLMAGISVFTITSPDFGPQILMMPLFALALLHLWRASGEGREMYWLALALDIGLMLLTSYLALLLVACIVAFLLLSPRGRASLYSLGAFAAAFTTAFMLLASVAVLKEYGSPLFPDAAQLRKLGLDRNLSASLRLAALILLAHFGVIILIVVSSNLPRRRQAEAAVVARAPIDTYARSMIYFFALVPVIAVTLLCALAGRVDLDTVAPTLLLSGLAIVVAGGDVILLYHQRILGTAWFALLLLPPVVAALGAIGLPALFAVELKTAQPADAIARYVTENFERRTGRRLEYVAGDARLASIIGVASRRRPHVIYEPGKGLPQLVSPERAAEQGAVVVWRATDDVGTPPAQVRAMFPGIVPEVPRVFARPLQGRAPLLRLGWGVVRPRGEPPQ